MFDDIKAKLLAFTAKEILVLTMDETKILGSGLDFLVKEFKAGATGEEAFTATLNKFYHDEETEGKKIAKAFLKFVSDTVHHFI